MTGVKTSLVATGDLAVTMPDDTTAVDATSLAEDEATVADARRLLESLLGDPLAITQAAQAWLRDLGIEIREDGATSAMQEAEVDELLARLAEEAERMARESAARTGDLGRVLGWIGTALACVVSAATSWCTGGASLVLGAAAVACMVAATTVQELVACGEIKDAEVAGGFAIGLSVLGTALSFGASAAGSAAQTAGTVASVVGNAAKLLGGAVDVTRGINAMVGSGLGFIGDQRAIAAAGHEMAANEDRDRADEVTEELRSLMRGARRMAESMAAAREARAEGMRAAVRG